LLLLLLLEALLSHHAHGPSHGVGWEPGWWQVKVGRGEAWRRHSHGWSLETKSTVTERLRLQTSISNG
jgi:hypothetical protein